MDVFRDRGCYGIGEKEREGQRERQREKESISLSSAKDIESRSWKEEKQEGNGNEGRGGGRIPSTPSSLLPSLPPSGGNISSFSSPPPSGTTLMRGHKTAKEAAGIANKKNLPSSLRRFILTLAGRKGVSQSTLLQGRGGGRGRRSKVGGTICSISGRWLSPGKGRRRRGMKERSQKTSDQNRFGDKFNGVTVYLRLNSFFFH